MGYYQKIGIVGICFLILTKIYGCTDFVVEATDGTLIQGRSLEFATDLKTELQVVTRNTEFISKGPNQKGGAEWTSKYGYLGAMVLGLSLPIDGLNEKGLSFGFLWLPGTAYQEPSKNPSKKAIDFTDFGHWILGNFSTIAELKGALSKIFVWGHPVPPLPGIPPVHVAVHDRLGNHLVIEFLQGEMKIYDNPNTVLTNYPPFDWQMINLQNYIELNPLNAPSSEWKGMTLSGSGQGSGFLGMPGDWTPPSRFVRMSTLLRFAHPVADQKEGVNLVEHLLNAVDIPKGEIRAQSGDQDYTQWVVIKDLTNRVFYFRSYRDLTLKFVDLKKLNFQSGAPRQSIPLDLSRGYLDIGNK
jgi:choloylglycine hydrolase